MRLSRPQIIILIALGALTVGVYVALVGILARNAQQVSQLLTITPASSPSERDGDGPTAAAAATTAAPPPTPTATATPTATPPAPQTRYDLQVASSPDDPALRVQRGYAYMALGAYGSAVADFDVALGLDPRLAEAYLGRGEAHFHLKEWQAAQADFTQALALNPDLAGAYAWSGHLLSQQGQHEAAVGALRKAVELDEVDMQKRLWLGDALLRAGDPRGAELAYTTVLSRESSSVEAYVGRGLAKAEQGALDAAWGDLQVAQGLAPYDGAVLNGLAWFYGRHQGDLEQAEALALRSIDRAEGDLERARCLYTLGWVYDRQGRQAEAAGVLEEAALLATVDGSVVYQEIESLMEQVR